MVGCLSALCLAAAVRPVAAEVKLPRIFGDHMVLQAEAALPVWGWAEAGEKVTVRLGAQEAGAVADAKGKWSVRLPTMKPGGPHEMIVTASNTIRVTDILVGEVWICSGQSNMAMSVGASADAKAEIAAAKYPKMRAFTVAHAAKLTPQMDVTGRWEVCGPSTAARFSGVAYYFGRELHRKLDVPVGLINTSWGGTRIEPWTTREALDKLPALAEALESLDKLKAEPALSENQFAAALAEHKKSRASLVEMEADEKLAAAMAAPGLDDADWKQMNVPGAWEKSALPGFDGLVWFRKTVRLPASWAGKDLVMNLCPIDEVDVTWFNGTEVGRTGSLKRNDFMKHWNVPRQYKVPGAAVKAGRNVIAIRVIDTKFAGGLWSEKPVRMELEWVGAEGEKPLPLAGTWRYKVGAALTPAPRRPSYPGLPTALYNGMIHPMVPFAIRGAIWYQGESNNGDGMLYYEKMKALIGGWRKVWRQGEFPFYFVQIAPFGRYAAGNLPRFWEAQAAAMSIPNTGMAVTIDVGDLQDIHPKNKQDVGRRLALWALAKTYGDDKRVYSGPMYKSMSAEGGKVRIRFDHVGGGLASRDGEPLRWFQIAGADRKFVEASAEIDGDTVVVRSEAVASPVAVRFAWDKAARPNLVNKEGLPASPFRTDRWPPPGKDNDAPTPQKE